MAHCKQTPQDFIKHCFTPQIAVISSPLAEETCKKNNLSFIEMIQPFCKLGTEVHYKDASGSQMSIRNLKITLVDIAARPPPSALARRYLNSSVSEAVIPKYQKFDAGEYKLEIPSATPWFEAWRDTFFQVQFPSDHEFTKHFLACILVVSSKDNNPVETMINLAQSLNTIMQDTSPTKLPKWFNNRILRYYLILHENSNGNHVTAVEQLDAMRVMYGRNSCFLLRMNSRPPGNTNEQLPDPWSQFLQTRLPVSYDSKETSDSSPNVERAMSASWEKGSSDDGSSLGYHPLSPETEDNPVLEHSSDNDADAVNRQNVLHGACLSTEDVEQIKLFIYEFCTKALLPYVEREMHQLNDYVANKRVSRSLLSATKRWFTPSKSGTNNVGVNTLIYSEDAPELQVRRLADLYFMFGNYSMAYQSYHVAKKEYQTDQAWLYYAGTLEMAGLSAFMCNESSRKILDNFEEGIVTYLNNCKLAQFATRATLLSTECMKSRGLYGEAAHHFIRMTSEESDLRSALLLEQACYCFLQCTKPLMFRKYAFHMVLAGHRFSKAAQKKHALRCYKQASQVYTHKGWNLAEDHVNFTIGRQANNLHMLEEAVNAFALMLSGKSKQSSQQQEIFLKEYLSAHIAYSQSQNAILTQILPLPLLNTNATKVLVGPASPLRTPGKVPAQGVTLESDDSMSLAKWVKLEEMLVHEAQGSLPMIFKPVTTLFCKKNTTLNPVGFIGEPIQVSVQFQNPLEIPLLLKDIYLLWQYKDKNNRFAANEIMGNEVEQMKTHSIKSITLFPNSTQDFILSITPLSIGEIVLKGVCYLLCCSTSEHSIKGKQSFFAQEKVPEGKENVSSKRFEITVAPSAPCLQVYFGEIYTDVIRNQIQQISVELRNISNMPLQKIYLATSVPELISVNEFQEKKFGIEKPPDLTSPPTKEKEARKNHVSSVPLPNGILEPGQCHTISLWLKAPENQDNASTDLLIYYENINNEGAPSYRLIRHTWNLKIQESMKLDCVTQRSCNSKDSEQVTFALKVQNLNQEFNPCKIEIYLLNTALLSDNWVLVEDVITSKNQSIRFKESEYVFLKAKRKKGDGGNYSEVAFVNSRNSEDYSKSAYLDFARRCNQFRVNIFNDCDNYDKIVSKNEGIIMVRWQASVVDNEHKKRACGQSIFVVESLGDLPLKEKEESKFFNVKDNVEGKRNLEEEKKVYLVTRNLITCNILHPMKVEHDFLKTRLCVVSVKLLLHSISESDLIVIVDALDTSNSNPVISQRPVLFYPHSSKNFRWIKSGKVLKQIKPLSTATVELFVAVVEPGTYDLGARLLISSHRVGEPETIVPQISRVESSLVIANCVTP